MSLLRGCKYQYQKKLNGIIVDIPKIDAVITILQKYSMNFEVNIECKTGDSIRKMSLEEIKNDKLLEQKKISRVQIEAESEELYFKFDIHDFWDNTIEITSNNEDKFNLIKNDIQEWIRLCKNKNPLIILTFGTIASNITIGILGLILSLLTWLPFLVKNSYPIDDSVPVIFVFAMLYFFTVSVLSCTFMKRIEIDIGINKHRIRRKIGGWILTTLIIPVILSFICSF